MLFNSLQFCAFFVIVTTLYYLVPRYRWQLLLTASCVFYMAFIPAYILVLAATITLDYCMGIKIAESSGKRRLLFLQVSILFTCFILFAFKYSGFFADSVRELQKLFGSSASFPLVSIILPIGLSFHTFQSLSYVIEVYRGHQEPERHFGIYALYVMFYPQLVAGPIERPQNLLHQFHAKHEYKLVNFINGFYLIAWGYFQKMVIADRAALYVNRAYGSWQTVTSADLLLATILFAVQIYADFSGYSSIAIGCARVMGFNLMQNFERPYFAPSISNFWRRWHISLSTWFKDYVYVPLGGSRVSTPRYFLNILITFGVSGLWHGANWTFIIWGVYHGLLLVIEAVTTKLLRTHNLRVPLGGILQRIFTLTAVCIGWVFFRAQSLHAAFYIIGRLGSFRSYHLSDFRDTLPNFSETNPLAQCLTLFLLIGAMFAVEGMDEVAGQLERGGEALRQYATKYFRVVHSPQYRQGMAVVLAETVLLFGVLAPSSFVYFQF
jgi:alginate O-acetyltransferase complex protein AlgI